MNGKAYDKLKSALAKNPGGLHRALKVPAGATIPANLLKKALKSTDKHVREMANLAKTAKGFKH